MAFRFFLLSRARKEISDAIEWYEKRQKGLGEIFLSEVESEIQQIVRNPWIYPESKGSNTNFRKAVLKRFPFLIIFKIDSEEVVIQSVFNTNLDPNKKP